MDPLAVSTVIPTHNRASLVTRAIKSALAASEPGDEVIVVDDGSTDDTEAVLARWQDRVRYIRTANAGAGAARNRGIAEARCPLIAFLDSDDGWMPDRLYLARAVMQARPDVVACGTEHAERHAGGREVRNVLRTWMRHPRVGFLDRAPTWGELLGPGVRFSTLAALPPGRPDFRVHVGDLYPAMMEAICMWTGTVLVRRAALGDRLRFPVDLPMYEEWECFGRVAGAGPMAYLDCETAWQYTDPVPRLTDAGALAGAAARIRVLTRVWGADPAFLAQHGARYRRVLARQHLTCATRLLRRRRLREASAELRQSHGVTPWDVLLATLPRQVGRWLTRLRCPEPTKPGHAGPPRSRAA